MPTIDSLQILVEVETIAVTDPKDNSLVMPRTIVKRIVRTFESRARAEEDLELLMEANPAARYRIDPVQHIER